MSASLPTTTTILLGLALLGACDKASSATSEKRADASAAAPAKDDAKDDAKEEAKADTPKPDAVLAKAPADAVAPRAAAVPAVAAAPAPLAAPDGAAPVAEGVVANGLSIVTHKVLAPKRTGDSKEDYWTQYQVWGEITNHSSEVMEAVTGTITFHDAAGAMIGIDSIGTAVKQDVGDDSPGETILGSVHFVQPGQTVPFHFMRNLDAIKGDIASHRVTPRRGTPVSGAAPKAVAVDVKERFEGEGFSRKRMFEATIRNDGEGGCRAPSLVVAFLDDAGKIAHVDAFDASDDLQKVLAKGETIAVSGGVYVTGDDAWREKAAVRTFVDCQPIY